MRTVALLLLPVALGVAARSVVQDKKLTLEADILQLNDTHVLEELSNPYEFDVNLVTYNKRLSADIEKLAFQVTQYVDGAPQTLALGRDVGFRTLEAAFPDHYERIAAGTARTAIFDLTRLFDIPMPGEYNVTFILRTLGKVIPNGPNMTENFENIKSYVFTATSATKVMRLGASSQD